MTGDAAIPDLQSALNSVTVQLDESQVLTGIGSWTWDVVTGEVTWSKGMFLALGIEPGSQQPSYALALEHVHPEDRDCYEATLANCLADKTEYYLQNRVTRAGDVRDVISRGSVIRDADGKPVRMFGTVQDVTDRRVAERRQAAFVATVSHELRTPLTAVHGVLSLLHNGVYGALSGEASEAVAQALENSQHLAQLIDDLLLVASDAGEYTATTPVPLGKMLHRSLALSGPFAEEHQVDLVLAEPVVDAALLVDPERFQRVMSNLVSNAVKWSNSGGQVRLATERVDGFVQISVADDGAGIPIAFRERVFDRFTMADGSTTRRRRGTGLGLAVARELVLAMSGRISFESKTDVGTTFTVAFPAYDLQAPLPT